MADQIADLKTRAETGDTEAMRELGIRMIKGEGVAQDQHEGWRWIHQAASEGDARACHLQGVVFLESQDPKIIERGVSALEFAAHEGLPESQYVLGLEFLKGKFVPHDTVAAMKWLQRAVLQGFPPAYGAYGQFLGGQLLRPFDALRWLRAAKAAGLSHWDQTIEQLTEFLTKDYGHADPDRHALEQITSFLGTEPATVAEGVEQLEARAAADELDCLFALAEIFEFGTGVKLDPERATSYLEKAADLGDPEGQWRLALRWKAGFEEDRNLLDALALLQKAAAQDFPPAQHALALVLLDANSPQQNRPEGHRLMKAAADAGFPPAVDYFKSSGLH